jgi:hypothetical protein
MQTWFFRLPATARMLITAVMAFAGVFGVMSLYTHSGPWGDTSESIVARLVVSMIVGVVTGVVGVLWGDQRMKRVFGSTAQALAYSRALRTGELPADDVDPVAWRAWLAVSKRSNRWAPASVGVFLGLALLQAVGHEWRMAALFVALAVWQSVLGLVMRRRISRLTAAVEKRAAEQSLGLP